MTFQLEVDADARRVRGVVQGPLSFADAEAIVARLFAEDLMGYDKLFDATAVRAKVSSADVARLSEIVKMIGGLERLGRCAVVVSDHLMLALVRMLGSYAACVADIRPFHRQPDAEEWLGWREEVLGPKMETRRKQAVQRKG